MVSRLICHTFAGATSFLAAWTERPFDCLVTDIGMPEMTGMELIERLQEEGAELPVIVLSSALDRQARAYALSLGVQAWFTKPVSDDRLLGAIAAAIDSGWDGGR